MQDWIDRTQGHHVVRVFHSMLYSLYQVYYRMFCFKNMLIHTSQAFSAEVPGLFRKILKILCILKPPQTTACKSLRSCSYKHPLDFSLRVRLRLWFYCLFVRGQEGVFVFLHWTLAHIYKHKYVPKSTAVQFCFSIPLDLREHELYFIKAESDRESVRVCSIQ